MLDSMGSDKYLIRFGNNLQDDPIFYDKRQKKYFVFRRPIGHHCPFELTNKTHRGILIRKTNHCGSSGNFSMYILVGQKNE
jgi:hypothetical protein